MPLSRPTIVAAVELLSREGEHAPLTKRLTSLGLESLAPRELGGVKQRQIAVLEHLIANPDAKGANGGDVSSELVALVLSERPRSKQDLLDPEGLEKTYREFEEAVASDGFEFSNGRLLSAGKAAKPAAPPAPTTYVVPDYELLEQIGDGGGGVVFRAKTKAEVQREVAVKVIHPHPFYEGPDPRSRFLREAEALSRLKHRAIVGYVSCGFTDDQNHFPYVALELVPGSTLAKASASMSFAERVTAIAEVLDALHYAHGLDVLHRDIKPTNILVRSTDKQVVIVDFGVAYLFEGLSAKSLTNHYVGSIGYIPSEVQADPKVRTAQHDVFACGVTLYEIIAGQRPDVQSYRPLAEIVDLSLATLDPIITKAIGPVATRYSDAAGFSSDLRAWLGQPPTATAASPRPRSKAVRNAAAVLGVGAAGLAATIAANNWSSAPASVQPTTPKETETPRFRWTAKIHPGLSPQQAGVLEIHPVGSTLIPWRVAVPEAEGASLSGFTTGPAGYVPRASMDAAPFDGKAKNTPLGDVRVVGTQAQLSDTHSAYLFLRSLPTKLWLGDVNVFYEVDLGNLRLPASPLGVPLSYQENALTQVLEHLRRSGISSVTTAQLERTFSTPGLRDGINPIFEPLSLRDVQGAIDELTKNGKIVVQGDGTIAF